MYARYGARATGKVAFNSEYAPADWDGKSYPNVVAMVLPKSVEDVIYTYEYAFAKSPFFNVAYIFEKL